MSSPPASSPPPGGSQPQLQSQKRRISLPQTSSKKPKHSNPGGGGAPPNAPSRKNSQAHPLRQTSFPPPESNLQDPGSPSLSSVVSGHAGGLVRAGSVVGAIGGSGGGAGGVGSGIGGGGGGAGAGTQEDDEDEGRDDYGTEAVLANGGVGGFAEDDAEKRKMAILLDAFDQDQNQRYEAFRRANLNKAAVKKLANQVLSQSVTANVGTVISGFAKVFTGEIIELALDIQKSWSDEGPLLPDHLREAWKRYRVEVHGSTGFRGGVGGGNGNAVGGGPGVGEGVGGGVGRLFR